MGFRLVVLFAIIFAGPTLMVEAQEAAPAAGVEIVVEADTYVPAFYRGRAEPVSGQPIRLIAIPSPDIAGRELSYSWKVEGRVLPETGNVATTAGPVRSSFVAQVIVSSEGEVLAQKSDVVSLSSPELLLYEMNPLRGLSSTAVGSQYNLTGTEAEFVAIPYFTGINTSQLKGTWRIDGQFVATGDDWRTLVLQRPEEPESRYTVELEMTSTSGFMERVVKTFYLNMGL